MWSHIVAEIAAKSQILLCLQEWEDSLDKLDCDTRLNKRWNGYGLNAFGHRVCLVTGDLERLSKNSNKKTLWMNLCGSNYVVTQPARNSSQILSSHHVILSKSVTLNNGFEFCTRPAISRAELLLIGSTLMHWAGALSYSA